MCVGKEKEETTGQCLEAQVNKIHQLSTDRNGKNAVIEPKINLMKLLGRYFGN